MKKYNLYYGGSFVVSCATIEELELFIHRLLMVNKTDISADCLIVLISP